MKRLLQLTLTLIIAFTMLGASSPTRAFDRTGHKLMCTCGCAQVLVECNHVGCPDSPGLIGELHSQIDAGLAEPAILNWFAAKYGATVLAAPLRGGFDNVAWIVPGALFVLGIIAVVLLVRMWKARFATLAAAAPAPLPPTSADTSLRDRIRSETNYE